MLVNNCWNEFGSQFIPDLAEKQNFLQIFLCFLLHFSGLAHFALFIVSIWEVCPKQTLGLFIRSI